MDLEAPQWSWFQAPGGSANQSYVGPVAGAYSDAARLAVSPLTRMLEQVLSSRLQEKAQLSQNRFAAEQMEREMQVRGLQAEAARADNFVHQMMLTDAKQRHELERLSAGGAAMSGALYGGDVPEGVAPGTGPLSFESIRGGDPYMRPPTQAQVSALGPQGVRDVYSAQSTDRTNARLVANAEQTDREQAAAATAKAQAETAKLGAAVKAIGESVVADDLKAALMARAEAGDPDGAAAQLADILTPAPQAKPKTGPEGDAEALFFPHDFGGGPIRLPKALLQTSDEYRVAQGAISKMPGAGKAALKGQAEELAKKGIATVNPFMAALLGGQMPGAAPEMVAAAQKALKERTEEQFTTLAQSLGWKTDEEVFAAMAQQGQEDRVAFGLSPEPVAPVVPPPPPEPTLGDRLLNLQAGAADLDDLVREGRRLGLFQSKAELEAWGSATPEQRRKWLEAGRVTLPVGPPKERPFPPR